MSGARLHKLSTRTLKLVAAAWLALVAFGLALLHRHANTPGQQATVIASWPAASQIGRDPAEAALLVFLHPHCPCARATLGQLGEIMAAAPKHVAAHVVFVVQDAEPDWQRNELWQQAAAIPGTQITIDVGAAEAGLFGADTSGFTLLFDRQGNCRFCGGITVARGHAGNNVGQDAIMAILGSRPPGTICAPTFGCPLFTDPANGR